MCGKVVFAAAAAAALATVLAAPAQADPETDALFVSVLDDEGIPYPSASEAIEMANAVCSDMGDGMSLAEATVEVSKATGLELEDSGFFVGAATAAYCPAFSPA